MSSNNSKVWFVTGAGSNFGKALVHALLAAGYCVAATTRDPSKISFPQGTDETLLLLSLDVTQPDQINDALNAALKHFGRIDFVVNKSGYAFIAELEATSDEDARKLFETQYWGPAAITKASVRIFREANPPGAGGRIFNISSGSALVAPPLNSQYAASKAALEALTASLNQELPQEWNINAVIVIPGSFEQRDAKAVMGSDKLLPPLPVYANAAPGSKGSLFRELRSNGGMPGIGDVDKMAQALIALAIAPREELPVRAILGSDAFGIVRLQAKHTLRDIEAGEKRARSTDKDGVDGVAVSNGAANHLGNLLGIGCANVGWAHGLMNESFT